MNYPGYQEWYKGFYTFIEKQREKDPALNVLHEMVQVTGNLASATPIAGPLCQSLFQGIDSYIISLGSKRKELRSQSQKMFLLTAKLSQFNYDKDLVEQQWEMATRELGKLQIHYDTILNQNLALLNVSREQYARCFSRENDAEKRYQFLTGLKGKQMNGYGL